MVLDPSHDGRQVDRTCGDRDDQLLNRALPGRLAVTRPLIRRYTVEGVPPVDHVRLTGETVGPWPRARAFDAIIAAIAVSRALPIYTFNPEDFTATGAELVDPGSGSRAYRWCRGAGATGHAAVAP